MVKFGGRWCYAESMQLFSRISRRNSLKAGFTLFELLVSISIIGLLIALATVSFSSAQAGARNSRRRGDLSAVRNAFEQYYTVNASTYPLSCSGAALASDLSPYLQGGLPSDPSPSNSPYDFSCAADGSSFCVCATLESGATGNADAEGTDGVCSFATGGAYYCVQSLQ